MMSKASVVSRYLFVVAPTGPQVQWVEESIHLSPLSVREQLLSYLIFILPLHPNTDPIAPVLTDTSSLMC